MRAYINVFHQLLRNTESDEYDVINYDPLLATRFVEPAEYLPIKPKKINIERLKRENNLETVGVEHIIPFVCDFVVEYIHSDVLVSTHRSRMILCADYAVGLVV